MLNSGIYMIRHRESGKTYIGRSVHVTERWALHKRHTEQHRDRSPLHRAMRKYGYDAFEWKVLVTAPARLQAQLEKQFMLDWGTMVPAGYNVGSHNGGQPSRELLNAMGEKERAAKMAEMRGLSAKMHATLVERRKDPAYDANYRARNKQAALKREVNRRLRLASDPEYAERERLRRKTGGLKSAQKIKERVEQDPAFGRRLTEIYRAAAKKARATDPRTLAAQARRGAN
jgi:group I intron endonuclease